MNSDGYFNKNPIKYFSFFISIKTSIDFLGNMYL